ncbi:TPA: hypothetical protein ACX6RQ_000627 [Photobacterium damselae]|uniref:hypothetical protein n=1 Tax=Photobacterium damselae TaxID=38293 RepID=UPI00124788A7|nr:hypothetical protein [Photobacterium damselae]KAB1180037.1 hypothetical protein F6477_09420 [Photobacterium damselae subsp. damselae]MBF7098282.1 hypothetical protein [Photobacterium damselae]
MTQTHELTQQEKDAIEELAINRVNYMNSDQVLVEAIDQKVHDMEEHLKVYFHERFQFHHTKAQQN